MSERTHGGIVTTTVVLHTVLETHAQEAASLHDARTVLSGAPQVNLYHLRGLDDRLAAHLDGLAVAGERAWPFCEASLQTQPAGAAFTATVRAIEEKQEARLDWLFTLADAAPEVGGGLTSAFEWLERDQLRGVIARLLESNDALKRAIGIGACAMHRVDPGAILTASIRDPRPTVRARALGTAGEIGRLDLQTACSAGVADADPDCQFWAAWSEVLLGDRNRALQALVSVGRIPGSHRGRAFRLALQAMTATASERLLRELATDPAQLRWVIQGSGIAGDPKYCPWLISLMGKPKTGRLAGEAFALITGTDLSALNLETEQPENLESGPNDNPDDANVDIDPDEGLPWSHRDKCAAWWDMNRSRFQAGTRYFMGAPVTHEHCIDVLKNGYQRQRILAAHYLCLLEPGTPLFNTSAPAWRQQRLLAEMK